MTNYILKLKQNIFSVTLVTSGIFGTSFVYLMNNTVDFFIEDPVSIIAKSGIRQSNLGEVNVPELSEMDELISGNLLRGVVTTLEDEEEIVDEQENFQIDGLTLIGIISGSRRYARASIAIKGEKSINSYAIGDEIRGGKLISIRRTSVIIKNAEGSSFTLDLLDKASQSNSKSAGSVASKRTVKNKNAKREKIIINRDRFKQLIKNQAELFRLKFSPSIQNGKINGWRLLKVPSDHFLYSMGARSGDTIRSYNGQKLENQERMIHMWQSLQNANQVSVEIERKGRPIIYDISIR